MAYVVTEPCFGCKYTDCVVVCPCDCFREAVRFLRLSVEWTPVARRLFNVFL